LVDTLHDWVPDSFSFFLLILEFLELSVGVALEPLKSFVSDIVDRFFLIFGELVFELGIVKLLLDCIAVMLKGVFGFDFFLDDVVFLFVLFSFFDKSVDFFFVESAFFVGNGNVLRFTSGFLQGCDVHDTIGVDVEGNLDLWLTSGGWWDTLKVEFTKKIVVFGHFSFTFINLNQDTWLVVSVGCEDLLFLGWDTGVSVDQAGHDSSSGLNTEGKWDNIQKEDILNFLRLVTGDNSSLNSSTVGNSLIGVDGSVWISAIEEIFQHRDDFWNSGGSTDHDDIVDFIFGKF